MAQVKAGAFTPYTGTISPEAKEAFDEALKGLVGIQYEPVAVSSQIVHGVNYNFFCNTETVTEYPIQGAAIVRVYKPLDEPAHITAIQDIH